MPDEISGAEIIKVEVPTVFEKSSQVVKEAIQQHQPDVVICVGQAGGRSAVSFERVAINLAEARIPDNEGNQPFDTALEENGPAAYFTSLPIKAMTKMYKIMVYQRTSLIQQEHLSAMISCIVCFI